MAECTECGGEVDGVGDSYCEGCKAIACIESIQRLKKYQEAERYLKQEPWPHSNATRLPNTGIPHLDKHMPRFEDIAQAGKRPRF
jgi:hypothetical protein